eukprot:g12968.t1
MTSSQTGLDGDSAQKFQWPVPTRKLEGSTLVSDPSKQLNHLLRLIPILPVTRFVSDVCIMRHNNSNPKKQQPIIGNSNCTVQTFMQYFTGKQPDTLPQNLESSTLLKFDSTMKAQPAAVPYTPHSGGSPPRPVILEETWELYPSIAAASRYLGMSTTSIRRSCQNGTATHGVHFCYADEADQGIKIIVGCWFLWFMQAKLHNGTENLQPFPHLLHLVSSPNVSGPQLLGCMAMSFSYFSRRLVF